jgi:hypothetical protein
MDQLRSEDRGELVGIRRWCTRQVVVCRDRIGLVLSARDFGPSMTRYRAD